MKCQRESTIVVGNF